MRGIPGLSVQDDALGQDAGSGNGSVPTGDAETGYEDIDYTQPMPQVPPAPEGGLPHEASLGDSFSMFGIEVTVHSIEVRKNLGSLEPLDADYASYQGVMLRDDGTIENDYSYVVVQVTYKNQTDSIDTGRVQLLQAKLACKGSDGNIQARYEAATADVPGVKSGEVPGSSYDGSTYEIAPSASLSYSIGFVVPDSELKKATGDQALYFLPDFSGMTVQYPRFVNAHWVIVPASV